jgi:hypothetical protein
MSDADKRLPWRRLRRVPGGDRERRGGDRPDERRHVSAEERAQGIALSCRVYPRSAVKLRVLGSKRAPGGLWPFLKSEPEA